MVYAVALAAAREEISRLLSSRRLRASFAVTARRRSAYGEGHTQVGDFFCQRPQFRVGDCLVRPLNISR